VEETALAVAAMTGRAGRTANDDDLPCGTHGPPCVARGLRWLMDRHDAGKLAEPSPIGFYFAKLWYFEKLYPLIFAAEAFRVASRPP
jgi:squalene-hopene/tetraprenyl-beta-curcumene cyclase